MNLSDEAVMVIASELARIDGYDPEDQHGGLYDLRWSGGPEPEPQGDAWNMDYLPRATRIAKALASQSQHVIAERDHAQACFQSAILQLTAIHAVMKPDRIELPDGRKFEFNNPAIEREMLSALCKRIRAIPDEVAALQRQQKP